MTQDKSGSWLMGGGYATIRKGFLEAKRVTVQQAEKLSAAAMSSAGSVSAFITQPDLLKWSEKLTESGATAYDKALDAEFLRTHLAGGNHRLFDEGHDLVSAWTRVKDASADDTFEREVIGYVQAIWKDVTTTQGLPFATWDQGSFGDFACTLAKLGINKQWTYDLVSYDVFEVLSAGLGCVGLLFALNRQDLEKLSELLGAMGITSILSANPLTGLVAIAVTAYAYRQKRNGGDAPSLDGAHIAKGALVAGLSSATFMLLGLPVLVELAIAMVVVSLAKKHAGDVAGAAKQLVARVQRSVAGTPSEAPPACDIA